jgi:RimJ/RimL family protein N-acetyltransferase
MVELQGVRVILREKRLGDAEYDYIWRCDPELAKLDAAYPLTMNYDRYLKIFQEQLRYPTPGSHHFAIDVAEGKFIGNCMYYDLDSISREAELGIVIGDRDYWSGAYGYDAVVTLLDYMFSEINLKRVYLHTLEWNQRAQRCFAKCGFNPVRKVRRMGQDFILMEIWRDEWFEKVEERLETRWTYLDERGGVSVAKNAKEVERPTGSPQASAGQVLGDS